MPDYECFPLWHDDGDSTGNIDPNTLNLSAALVSKLNNWCSEYDKTLNKSNPKDSGFLSKEKEVAFVVEGYELAKALKSELVDIEVVYYDIDQMRYREI